MRKTFKLDLGDNDEIRFTIPFDDKVMDCHISGLISNYFDDNYEPYIDADQMAGYLLSDYLEGEKFKEILVHYYGDELAKGIEIMINNSLDDEFEKQLFEICKYYALRYKGEA